PHKPNRIVKRSSEATRKLSKRDDLFSIKPVDQKMCDKLLVQLKTGTKQASPSTSPAGELRNHYGDVLRCMNAGEFKFKYTQDELTLLDNYFSEVYKTHKEATKQYKYLFDPKTKAKLEGKPWPESDSD